MDINKYLNTTAEYKELIGIDEETQSEVWSDPIQIPVFKYGKMIFIRDPDQWMQVSGLAYITTYPIKIQGMIDGQPVRGVTQVPKFIGSDIELYEGYTYKYTNDY